MGQWYLLILEPSVDSETVESGEYKLDGYIWYLRNNMESIDTIRDRGDDHVTNYGNSK